MGQGGVPLTRGLSDQTLLGRGTSMNLNVHKESLESFYLVHLNISASQDLLWALLIKSCAISIPNILLWFMHQIFLTENFLNYLHTVLHSCQTVFVKLNSPLNDYLNDCLWNDWNDTFQLYNFMHRLGSAVQGCLLCLWAENSTIKTLALNISMCVPLIQANVAV